MVADIGSGTGISARLFLDNGNTVYAVEPNEAMRKAAEEALSGFNNFHSVCGSSEHTTLQEESVDLIVAAQAFHWFDPVPTKKEFLRILKPSGYLVVLYNRRFGTEGFMKEYLSLIEKYSENYINKEKPNSPSDFFEGINVQEKILYNPQKVDLDGLKGNLLSYSYIPMEEDPCFPAMISELEGIFDRYNINGEIVLEYNTFITYCRLK